VTGTRRHGNISHVFQLPSSFDCLFTNGLLVTTFEDSHQHDAEREVKKAPAPSRGEAVEFFRDNQP
jgi:hypothetical protein